MSGTKGPLAFEGYITIGQASKQLGLSVDTLRRWDGDGILTAQRLDGKNRYYSLEDIKAYQANKPLSTSEVAAILEVSESSVRRLEAQGLLTPQRGINGKREYARADVTAYISQSSSLEDILVRKPAVQALEYEDVVDGQQYIYESREPLETYQTDETEVVAAFTQVDSQPEPLLSTPLIPSVSHAPTTPRAVKRLAKPSLSRLYTLLDSKNRGWVAGGVMAALLAVTMLAGFGSIGSYDSQTGRASLRSLASAARPTADLDIPTGPRLDLPSSFVLQVPGSGLSFNITNSTITGTPAGNQTSSGLSAGSLITWENLSPDVQARINQGQSPTQASPTIQQTLVNNNVINNYIAGPSGLQIAGTGSGGQLILVDGSGVPTYMSLGGDATLSVLGALTLANVNASPGTYGDGTHTASLTVDAKGRITGISNTIITGAAPTGSAAGDLSGNFPTPSIAKLQGTNLAIGSVSAGQVLQYNGSAFVNQSLSGDISLSSSGVATIAAGSVSNSKLANSSLSINAGTGLSGGGNVALGGSTGLSVAYGSTASTAVQGNTTLTCASGSGNLSGGGNIVTLGAGGSCGALSTVTNPNFSGGITAPSLTSASDLSLTAGSGTVLLGGSLIQTGGDLAFDLNSGTNKTFSLQNSGAGVTNLNIVEGSLQTASVTRLTNAGVLQNVSGNNANGVSLNANTITAGTLSASVLPTAATLQGNSFNGASQLVQLNGTGKLPALDGSALTNITAASLGGTASAGQVLLANASGVPTFTSLSGDVTLSSSGVTVIGAGKVTNSQLANNSLSVNAGTGLNGGGAAALGGSTSLSVLYGSAAGTAVQGNITFVCPAGTGSLSGGGNTITLGTGGSCGSLSVSSSPTFGGTVTLSGLNSVGVVHTNASGVLSTSAVALGTDTSGSYVGSLGTLTGLSTTGNSGANSTPTLSITYGSTANTAVQGNTTLVCASGSGNLTGGGNSVTLGAGGTCGTIGISNSPSFTTSITTPSLQSAAALGITSGGSGDVSITAASNKINIGATSLATTGSLALNLASATATTFTLQNSGGGAANFNISSGVLQTAGTTRLTNSGVLQNVTGDNADGVSLNANTITNGTVADGRLSSNVTLLGNTFNGVNQLVKLDGTGKLPALDGSALTGIAATSYSGTLAVSNGGTGKTSIASNGVLYGNGTGALGVTTAGTSGQILLANASGVPTFTSLSGDVTVSNSGVTTIGAGKVTNTQLANSAVTVGAGTGLTGGGSVALGASTSLSVSYGAVAGSAVQGSTTLICPGGSGNLSGGGNTVTLGAGGTCGGISLSNAPTFSTSVTTPSLSSSGALALSSSGVASDITITSGSGKVNIGATSLATSASLALDLSNASTTALTLQNSGGGAANFNLASGSLQTAGTVRLSNSGALQNVTGDNTNGVSLNANTITAGTLADGRLSTNVTLQGNTFNGANQLVKLDGTGKLPALDGSALTGITATSYSGTLGVANGGTGKTSVATNGLVYGNGTGALGVTTAGTAGQVLLANASGVPTFTSLSGDVTVSSTGVTAIGSGKISNGNLASGSYGNITAVGTLSGLTASGTITLSALSTAGVVHTNASGVLSTSAVALGTDTSGSYVTNLGTLTGLTTSGNSGAGATPTLSVTYGSTANTAVQGSTSLVCASGSGNLSGGGNTITLGSGGTCSGITMTSTPSFTSVTTSSLTSSGALSLSSTGSNDLTLTSGSGTVVLGGSTIKNSGSLTHDLNGAGAYTLTVTNSGTGTADLNLAKGGLQVGGTAVLTSGRVLQNLTAITSAGTITLSGLSTGGVVHNNASGVLSTSAVALGTDTSGSYVTNLGTLTGLSTTGNSGAGATPTLSVAYGSTANTAVQGSTSLVCASGSGNLSGGGNTITLGSGGTCSGITAVNNPSFSTSVTAPVGIFTGANALTLGTTGTSSGAIVFKGSTAASGTVTLQGPANPSTSNYTLSIPSLAANDTVCLQTLANCGGGNIGGSGTANYVARFTGSSALGTGQLYDNGTSVSVGGSSPSALFNVGSTNQFQVSSAGAVTATGLTSSGTTTLSGLSTAGIVHTNASGVLSTSAVALGTDTSGSYVSNLGTLTGLSTTGNSGAGATPTLSVTYGSTANTAVQGNVTLTCPSGSGNLSGGGTVITLGSGGTCGALSLTNTPSFTGVISSSAATTGLALTGAPVASATSSLAQFGSAIASGNAVTNGGTYLGLNAPSTGAGSAADFLNFQLNGTSKLLVTNAGNVTAAGQITSVGINSGSGLIQGTGGLSVGGTVTLSGLNSAGVVHTNASGVLSTSAIALGTDTSGSYVGSLGTLAGLSTTGNSGANSTPTLSVTYGSTTNTAVQGSTSLVCASGSGNLSGGGNTITLGSGGTCSGITMTSTPSFTSLGTTGLTNSGTTTLSALSTAGVVHNNASGVLSTSAVALGTDTSGSYVANLGTLTGLSATGNSGAGATPTLSVAYGSTANTAVQGNVTLTCPSGSGNLSGGGTVITLGSGGTCGALSLTSTPSFTGAITSSSATTGLALTGAPAASATSSLAQFGSAIAGGNSSANGGTYLGLNAPSTGAGSAADFLNFQLNGTSKLLVTNAGALTAAGLITSVGLNAGTGLIQGTGGLTIGGTTTLSSLNSAGIVHTNASGVLSTSAVALGTDTSGSYVNSLGTLTGLTASGNSGANSTPTLSVAYGSTANTAVQGNTSLVCASGSGNLSGGGNTITLGSGGTCSGLTMTSTPSFTSVTTASLTSSGALSLSSTGSNDLTLTSGSGTIVLGGSTVKNTGSLSHDLNGTGANTFTVTNSGTGTADVNIAKGGLQIAGTSILTSGKALQNLTGLTVASGGANITGGLTSAGTTTLSALSTAGVVHNNASGVLSTSAVALGTDTSGSYVANLGTLTGLSTTGNSGAGATPTLSVSYGSMANTAVQGNTTLTCASGSGNLSGGGNSITLGSGGTCSAISLVSSPTLSGTLAVQGSGGITVGVAGTTAGKLVLASAGTGSVTLQSVSQANAVTLNIPADTNTTDTICLQTLANCAGSGGISGTGTTNYVARFTGSSALGTGLLQDSNSAVYVSGSAGSGGGLFNVGTSNQFQISSAGAVTATGLTTSGTVTLSGLSSAGIVHTNASGVLSTSAVTLGTDTSGSYVANLGTLTGLSTTGNSGAGATPTLSVSYGSMANTAVQGNTTLTCSAGSGNLSGGGDIITLGSGGTCSGITLVSSPTFSGSLTSAGLSVAGLTTINTTGTADTSIGNNTGTFSLASSGLDISTSGALSGVTTLSMSGGISGVTTYAGSSDINTTGGSLQTNSLTRIDNSGNLTNIGNLNTTGASTFTAAGSNGFTFKAATDNTSVLAVKNSAGQNVLSVDTTGVTNNLVSNASIESAISGNWSAHSIGTGGTVTQDSTQAYYGSNSLKMTVGTGTTVGGAQQTLSTTLSANTQYNVFFYAKGNAAATVNPIIKAVYSVDGTTESLACTNTITLEYRTWQRYSCTFTTPASGITSSNAIFIEATTASQTFYVDGVMVQLSSTADPTYREGKVAIQGTISTPLIIQNSNADNTSALLVNNKDGGQIFNVDTGDYNNFVANPSFEVNTNGWSAVGTGASIARDTSQQKYGVASMKVVSGTAVSGGARYTLPTPLATGSYSVSFSMLTTVTDHSFIKVGYNNGTTDAFTTCSTTSPAASASQAANVWVRYVCANMSLTTPSSIIFDSSVANKTFYIDAVQVESGATASSYGLGQISFGGTVVTPLQLRPSTNATNAFQVQNTTGSNIFTVDTANASAIVTGTMSVSGAVTLSSTVTLSGAVTANSTITANGTLSVTGTTTTFLNLTLTNAHFKVTQTNLPTSITLGTCAGTPVLTTGSADSAGSFTTGSLTTGGACTATITFNKAFAAAPKSVILTPKTSTAPAMNAYVSSSTATTFVVTFTGSATTSTAYDFYYWVVE